MTAFEKFSQFSSVILGQPGDIVVGLRSGVNTQFLFQPGIFNVQSYGAKGDGITDDTAAIINAIFAGSGSRAIFFPAGTYIVSQPIFGASDIVLIGVGPVESIIQAKAGAAVSAVFNFSSSNDWQFRNLQVDANNRSGGSNGSAIFTATSFNYFIDNVYIRDCAGRGLDLSGPDTSALFGMQPTVTNVIIDTTGSHGFYYNGAHDGHFANIEVIDAGQLGNNGESGFFVDSNTNGRWFNCHAWSRSTTANRMFAAFHLNNTAGNQFVACDMEGAFTANLYCNGDNNQFIGCQFFSAWNGVNVLIRQSDNSFFGCHLDEPGPGRSACVGFTMGLPGDFVTTCFIDAVAIEQQAGVIDFTNETGDNTINIRAFQSAGTSVVGAPASTDSYNIVINNNGTRTVWVGSGIYTVAQLGAAGPAGSRAVVSDATVTTFATIVAGLGGNTVPVYSDGSNWRIG